MKAQRREVKQQEEINASNGLSNEKLTLFKEELIQRESVLEINNVELRRLEEIKMAEAELIR